MRSVATGVALLLSTCGPSAPPSKAPIVKTTPVEEDDPDPSELCRAYWEAHPRPPGSTLGPNERYLECLAVGAGAWRVEEEVVGEEHECFEEIMGDTGVEVRMRVRYDAVDGAHAGTEWESIDTCESHIEHRLLGHHDYDGDGHHEVALVRTMGGVEWWSSYPLLLSFDGASVGEYAPANDAVGTLERFDDFDGDGRPDLIVNAPHARGSSEGDETGGGFHGGPLTLWHARADGTFSRSDEVAVRFLREGCEDAGAPYVHAGELECVVNCCENFALDDSIVNVRCARLRGVSAEAIRTALVAQLREPCHDPELEQACCRWAREQLIEDAENTDTTVRLAP